MRVADSRFVMAFLGGLYVFAWPAAADDLLSDCEYYEVQHQFRMEDHPDFATWQDLSYQEVNVDEFTVPFYVSNDGTTSSRFRVVLQPGAFPIDCPTRDWDRLTPYFLDFFASQTVEQNPTPEEHGVITILSQSATEVEFEYTHPTDPPEPGQPFRVVWISVWGPPDSPEPKWAQLSIHVHRTPVVMVHGLWSEGSAFRQMEAAMRAGDYLPHLTYRADYKQSNSEHFSVNRHVVPDAITALIQKNVDTGHAAGKVDVVGHSMGGILTRNYLQDSRMYRNDVRRVITCNTPHSGSQLANFLLDPNHSLVTVFLCDLLALKGMTCYEGAVNDLGVGSVAINGMNGRRNNHPDDVYVHALTTVAPPLPPPTAPFDSVTVTANHIKMIAQLSAAYGSYCLLSFLPTIFNNDDNDAIVALDSQAGGLQSLNTSAYDDQIHMGSTDNIQVIDRVIALLQEADPNTSFTTTGYDGNPNVTYVSPTYCPPSEPAPLPEKAGAPGPASLSTLTIESPVNGTTVTGGQAAAFTVTGASPDSTLLFVMTGPGDQLLTQYQAGSNTIFNVAIPEDFAGQRNVRIYSLSETSTLLGRTQDDYSVVVAPTSQVTSFEVYPNPVYLKVGQSRRIEITGAFADGISRDIASMPDVAMTMQTPRATVSDGIISLRWPTNNTLTVSINGITNSVQVISLGYDGVEVGLDGAPEPAALAIDGMVQGTQIIVEEAAPGLGGWTPVDNFTSASPSTNRLLPGAANPSNGLFRVKTVFE